PKAVDPLEEAAKEKKKRDKFIHDKNITTQANLPGVFVIDPGFASNIGALAGYLGLETIYQVHEMRVHPPIQQALSWWIQRREEGFGTKSLQGVDRYESVNFMEFDPTVLKVTRKQAPRSLLNSGTAARTRPNRPTKAVKDTNDQSSDHAFEDWPDEVPEDYGSEDDKVQELGKPDMEEGEDEDGVVQDYCDENGELVKKQGLVTTGDQEKAVREDKTLERNLTRRVNRFRAIFKIHG
ncbi:MAG: hypothetical protein L6R38_009255, partial [Xanthoria sp. 2 TBL-2021]